MKLFRIGLLLAVGLATMGAASSPYVDRPVPQPHTDCDKRCVSPALLRSVTPTLTVKVSGTEGYFLYTDFEVRLAPRPNATMVASADNVFSSGYASWRTPELLAQTPYFWRARTTNEIGIRGPWTRWQMFAIDTTAPALPEVSSSEYPEKQWGAVLGTEGNFHFSSDSADVVDFVSYTGSDPWLTTPATGFVPRTALVTYTPKQDLVNVLNVYALDAAGNRSETYPYQFLVTPLPPEFAHWRLDGTAEDSGNLSAHGTLHGAVEFGPGYVGGSNGAVFSGGRIATDTTVLDTTRSFTVMAWVNPSSLTPGTVVSQDGLRLYAGDTTWCAALGTHSTCVGAVEAGLWVHVAARYNAITGSLDVLTMGGYGCFGEDASVPAAGGPASNVFTIGDGWTGSIDDVQAHRRALADSEICQHALQ